MILMTESGQVLSTKIRNFNPFNLTEGGVIINRLLDGSVNVQSIGENPKTITFEALVEASAVDFISEAYVNGEKLLIKALDGVTAFNLTEQPNFERFNSRYHRGKVVAKIKGVEQ